MGAELLDANVECVDSLSVVTAIFQVDCIGAKDDRGGGDEFCITLHGLIGKKTDIAK